MKRMLGWVSKMATRILFKGKLKKSLKGQQDFLLEFR